MTNLDWVILCLTLGFIVVYGMWKSRHTNNVEGFLLANRKMRWYHVGLSVMATQASAITFLSAPGQGFSDGLRFVQFYFGLPLAMVVLCITFVPIFHKLNVYTAYEYLEKRFDNKTRSLTAGLFLLQRGLSTGITIYAPAIILSAILGVSLNYTILLNGVFVIIYTVYGGSKAVSHTQTLQMAIIFSGLFIAAFLVIYYLPDGIGFTQAMNVAGAGDKINAINLNFDWNDRYTLWSGLIGGFFLQLSYFGTDQSQVGRYLTGSSIYQSRMGLVMNGLVKIPMQFLILGIGVMVFVFYQFYPRPLFFDEIEVQKTKTSIHGAKYEYLEKAYEDVNLRKAELLKNNVNQLEALTTKAQLIEMDNRCNEIRDSAKTLIAINNPEADTNDSNYVFLTFVKTHLPKGIVGLLIAVIFLASMGSTASGLNSLASTTSVDFYKRIFKKDATEQQYLNASRWATFGWGVFCVVVALFASRLGNLIEAVNVLGSYFYGTILGIFLVAFYMKKIGGTAVFYAAVLTEIFVIVSGNLELTSYLWLNVIGCLMVMGLAFLLNPFTKVQAGTDKA